MHRLHDSLLALIFGCQTYKDHTRMSVLDRRCRVLARTRAASPPLLTLDVEREIRSWSSLWRPQRYVGFLPTTPAILDEVKDLVLHLGSTPRVVIGSTRIRSLVVRDLQVDRTYQADPQIQVLVERNTGLTSLDINRHDLPTVLPELRRLCLAEYYSTAIVAPNLRFLAISLPRVPLHLLPERYPLLEELEIGPLAPAPGAPVVPWPAVRRLTCDLSDLVHPGVDTMFPNVKMVRINNARQYAIFEKFQCFRHVKLDVLIFARVDSRFRVETFINQIPAAMRPREVYIMWHLNFSYTLEGTRINYVTKLEDFDTYARALADYDAARKEWSKFM